MRWRAEAYGSPDSQSAGRDRDPAMIHRRPKIAEKGHFVMRFSNPEILCSKKFPNMFCEYLLLISCLPQKGHGKKLSLGTVIPWSFYLICPSLFVRGLAVLSKKLRKGTL